MIFSLTMPSGQRHHVLKVRCDQIFDFLCDQEFIAVPDREKQRTLKNALRTQKRRTLNVLRDGGHQLSPSRFERVRAYLKDEGFIMRLIGSMRQERHSDDSETWYEAAMREGLVRRLFDTAGG